MKLYVIELASLPCMTHGVILCVGLYGFQRSRRMATYMHTKVYNGHFYVTRAFRWCVRVCVCILGNESLLPSNGFKVAQHEMDFVDTTWCTKYSTVIHNFRPVIKNHQILFTLVKFKQRKLCSAYW